MYVVAEGFSTCSGKHTKRSLPSKGEASTRAPGCIENRFQFFDAVADGQM
jgi:hypothetical protein